MSIFDQFTGLYELSKTLRFELKPVGKTKQLLEENEVFRKDNEIAENYVEVKKYFDELHVKFIKESLDRAHLDCLDKYWKAYCKNEKLDDLEKKLRKAVVEFFNAEGENWVKKYAKENVKLEGKGYKILGKKEIINLLIYLYPEQKKLFEKFRGFFTYFSGFNKNRENFYSAENKSTAISNRIVNENLKKFCANKKSFRDNYDVLTLNSKEREIFELKCFNGCLLQEGIDKYNELVGSVNSKVNKYRQKHKDKRIPFLKELFKQILEERGVQGTEQNEFVKIEKDEEVFEVLAGFIKNSDESLKKAKKLVGALKNKKDDDLEGIYIKGSSINTISSKWFASWFAFGDLLPKKGSGKLKDFISLAIIKKTLEDSESDELFALKGKELKKLINGSETKFDTFLKIFKYEFDGCIREYEKSKDELLKVVKKDKAYSKKPKQKKVIKNYADSALAIYRIVKYFALEKGKENVEMDVQDDRFYNEYNEWLEGVKTWLYYNEFRNYLTKKPYSKDKIKLNFENGTLLGGWDKNKESDNYSVIFRKDGKYFLGIMHKKYNHIFDEKRFGKEMTDCGTDVYEKMYYKQIGDISKQLPRIIFSKKNLSFFNPTDEIIKIKNEELFKVGNAKFSLKSLHKMVDFYKGSLKLYEDWKVFNFVNVKPTAQYKKNIGEFYGDVENNSYKVWFKNISADYVDRKVEDGELYLFEIYNKDFSNKRSGKKNLHTIYWENLFLERNLRNPLFKLNGEAEIFCRKASLDSAIDKARNTKRTIIGKKRYTEDKYLFHCPIKVNFCCKGGRLNDQINGNIIDSDKIRLIGIDRGEKHLLYISVTEMDGNILKVKSLNKIDNGNREYDYHNRLHKRETERGDNRKSWQGIEGIKDLKAGYISQAVHEIDKLIFESLEDGCLPIIVFEDLNSGFKRGRFKIEKQVYQKFELALAKKLNYLVSKERRNYLGGLQLTPKVDNFQDIGNKKQVGIIFYIPASYTSAICPACGFRKRLFRFGFKNIEQSKKMLSKHKFRISNEGNRFKFECVASVGDEKKSKLKNPIFEDVKLNNELVFYSDVKRLIYSRGKDNKSGRTDEIDVDKKLRTLFKNEKIDIDGGIMEQLVGGKFSAGFYKELIFYINMILKLRNSDSEKGADYILCPACYFYSDDCGKFKKKIYSGNDKFEFNGDANGAYNIARKGIVLMKKIKQAGKKKGVDKIAYEDMVMNMDEWDKYVQNKKIW